MIATSKLSLDFNILSMESVKGKSVLLFKNERAFWYCHLPPYLEYPIVRNFAFFKVDWKLLYSNLAIS